MQPDQASATEDRLITFSHNHATALSAIKGPQTHVADQGEEPPISLELERILADHATGELVPFEGEEGVESLLLSVAASWPTFKVTKVDGHVATIAGDVSVGAGEVVALEVSLGAGAQVVCKAGPAQKVLSIMAAIDAFDRQVHVESCAMGKDYELLSEGYNPLVSSPLDIPLVPQTRWTLLTAHLSQTGRYSRDVMRCGCSTAISIEHNGDRAALAAYRLATALSPILSFITDNVRSFRGAGARRSPRMVHAIMWDEVDPSRCGVVPGTYSHGFSFDTYLEWLEGTQAILFTSDDGTTVSCGKGTTRELMEERELTLSEATRLLYNVHPYARLLDGAIELPSADSLRPRMATGYLAFIKGLFCTAYAVDSAYSLFGNVRDQDVNAASETLRRQGWDATVYGRNVGSLVDELVRIARTSLSDPEERRLIDRISELWEVRMVPRDTFVHQEIKASRGW